MTRFEPSPGFEAQAEKDLRDGLLEVAAHIARDAGTRVPKGTGHYADSVRPMYDDRGVVVASNDPGAHAIELGSKNNPTWAPLRRAGADAAKRFEIK